MKKQVIRKLSLFLCVFITLVFANFTNALGATLPSRMYIDSPNINQVIDSKSFDVLGWALNASGIKDVKVYIDGNLKGNATYGLSRPDVAKVFKGYTNGDKSGFSYHVDINAINSGTHRISVYANGKNGTSQHTDFNVTIVKKVPRMYIESPTTTIKNTTLDVIGWSLNPSGMKAVQVFMDGNFISNAKYGLQRNDVNTVFPGYPNGNLSGFSYNLNVSKTSSGIHKLTVISVGNDGSTQSLDKTINIVRKSPIMYIDSPINNFSTTDKNLNVAGWALNDSGINTIQYYLNDQYVGSSSDGIQRSDVNAAFPGYVNGSTSGFSFSFNVMKYIQSGTQNATLKIVVIGNDGTSTTQTQNLVLKKLPEKIYIETPTNNETIKNNISLTGWTLNASGVTSVKVYIDDVFNGNADYGFQRPDVNSAYPGYTDGLKSGFKYTIDATKLTMGDHTLRVDSIGNDGKVASQSISIIYYGMVNYEYYNYSLTDMVTIQYNAGAVYQNTTTWTWDRANKDLISKYIDAPSIVNDPYAKYEFLKLSYNDGASVTDLNNILSNKGILKNKGQVFLTAGKTNNVNPIYLISHALLETGNGTSNLANGILVSSVDGVAVTPRVVYNFFGIGAYDSNPDKFGSERAYKEGWFTPDDAINGGAAFISKGYINSATNQDTLYKMRWNPANPGTHQYATDVRWAYNQVYNIKNLIDQCPNSTLYYNIPIFK